jgi:hypothetical protein
MYSIIQRTMYLLVINYNIISEWPTNLSQFVIDRANPAI